MNLVHGTRHGRREKVELAELVGDGLVAELDEGADLATVDLGGLVVVGPLDLVNLGAVGEAAGVGHEAAGAVPRDELATADEDGRGAILLIAVGGTGEGDDGVDEAITLVHEVVGGVALGE